MYFDTLQDAIYMNGHGAFVWAAYAISFLVLIALVVAPLGKTRRFLREESRRLRRDGVLNDGERTQDAK
jgi:heme exporter protein D